MAGRQKGKYDSCGCRSSRDPALLQSPLDNGISLCPSPGRAKGLQHDGLDGAGTLTAIQCLEKELPLPGSLSPRGAFPRPVKKKKKNTAAGGHTSTRGRPGGIEFRPCTPSGVPCLRGTHRTFWRVVAAPR